MSTKLILFLLKLAQKIAPKTTLDYAGGSGGYDNLVLLFDVKFLPN